MRVPPSGRPSAEEQIAAILANNMHDGASFRGRGKYLITPKGQRVMRDPEPFPPIVKIIHPYDAPPFFRFNAFPSGHSYSYTIADGWKDGGKSYDRDDGSLSPPLETSQIVTASWRKQLLRDNGIYYSDLSRDPQADIKTEYNAYAESAKEVINQGIETSREQTEPQAQLISRHAAYSPEYAAPIDYIISAEEVIKQSVSLDIFPMRIKETSDYEVYERLEAFYTQLRQSITATRNYRHAIFTVQGRKNGSMHFWIKITATKAVADKIKSLRLRFFQTAPDEVQSPTAYLRQGSTSDNAAPMPTWQEIFPEQGSAVLSFEENDTTVTQYLLLNLSTCRLLLVTSEITAAYATPPLIFPVTSIDEIAYSVWDGFDPPFSDFNDPTQSTYDKTVYEQNDVSKVTATLDFKSPRDRILTNPFL